jgi:hypothetical protein
MILARALRTKCALLVMVCAFGFGLASDAAAQPINLAWDASGGTVGYKVHVGAQSGSYTQHFDVGSATQFTFTTATAGQRYCFAVSAYLLSSQLEGPNSAEVCGFGNAPPTIQNPGNRTSVVGQATSLQLVGSDPASQPLSYSATGLPPGLSVQASTGFISGTGTTAGSYTVTARASDGTLSDSETFTWVMTTATGDTARPTISITSPTTGTSHSTTASTVNLAGSASDNVAVTQVRWSSDRGGSGNATGLTGWSVASVPLLTGTNVITVTAVDAAGNTGTDTLTVTRSGSSTDTAVPSVSIASPTTATSYTTRWATVNLAGSAADNVRVALVRWATNSGRTGSASGTTSWSATGIPLADGSNVVTITAQDAAGNQATRTLTVMRTTTSGDTTKPTITIRTPTTSSSHTASASPLTIGGVASDNVGVAQVTWSTDRGGSGTANGTTSWSAAIPLLAGSNVVTVRSIDAAGNQASDSITVTYSTTTPPPTGTVTLSAEPLKTSWFKATRLTWSNAPWSSVDVYRNGMRVTNTSNDGSHLDPIWNTGSFAYKICAAGSTTTCSNTITVYY